MPCNRETIKDIIKHIRKSLPYIKIWLYTGYSYKDMDKECKQICKLCDVIVDGPYIEALKDSSLCFRGSSNQNIIKIKK